MGQTNKQIVRSRPMAIPLGAEPATRGTIRTAAAAEICGMKWWTMLRRVRAGKVRPPLERAGQYRDRAASYSWSLREVFALRVASELRTHGVGMKTQDAAVTAILAYRGNDIASAVLVATSEGCCVLQGDLGLDELARTLNSDRFVSVWSLTAWAMDVERRFRDQLAAAAGIEETA